MAYFGKKIPAEIKRTFNAVAKARDMAIATLQEFLKKGVMPTGREIDAKARDLIKEKGFDGKFLHGLGHALGTKNAHGSNNNFNSKNNRKILTGLGYTIEPGIYFEKKFGVRSEVNIYISSGRKVLLISKKQEEIYLLKILTPNK
jgi:Xaa-Pro aminopeptidase